MKTKEEVIKEAYIELIGEERFNEMKAYIDDNGWIHYLNFPRVEGINPDDFDLLVGMLRPIQLNGIETNNGWTVILSEADLPSENIDCHFELKDTNQILIGSYVTHRKTFVLGLNDYSNVIAYRPIETPPKRVY